LITRHTILYFVYGGNRTLSKVSLASFCQAMVLKDGHSHYNR